MLEPLRPYLRAWLTDPLWVRLAGKRLFITGGSGLFGSWFLASLVEANERLDLGIEAWVLSRHPRPLVQGAPHRCVTWLQGDVQTFDDAGKLEIDLVLHMASTSAAETYAGASGLSKLQTLYGGASQVCRLAAKWGARVLMTSSGAVYGNAMPLHVQEDDVLRLRSDFTDHAWGVGKAAAEQVLFQHVAAGDFEGVVCRCFSVLGPGLPLDLHYAAGNFVADVLAQRPIRVRGDGSPLRSYLYLADVVAWLLKMLVDGRSGEIYHLGSDEAISVLDLAQRLACLSEVHVPIEVMGSPGAAVGVPVMNTYVPSIAKARRELALDVFTPLDTALGAMLSFERKSKQVREMRDSRDERNERAEGDQRDAQTGALRG